MLCVCHYGTPILPMPTIQTVFITIIKHQKVDIRKKMKIIAFSIAVPEFLQLKKHIYKIVIHLQLFNLFWIIHEIGT